ncbi:hypothetical protein HQ563_14985 [bacterium]|nr:hypothetical protein [bacterium]
MSRPSLRLQRHEPDVAEAHRVAMVLEEDSAKVLAVSPAGLSFCRKAVVD